jgi:hypothetical protein
VTPSRTRFRAALRAACGAVVLLGAAGVIGVPDSAAGVRPAVPFVPRGQCATPQPPGAVGNASSDIDGDRVTDPVVGEAGRSPSGGVVVYGSRSGDAPRFFAGSDFAGLNASPSFGTAITRFDVNRDGCDDLVVTDPDHVGGAAVDVLWGSPTGLRTTGAMQVLEHDGAADDFGAAIGLAPFGYACEEQQCPTTSDLYVGAPGRTVDGQADAGAIEYFAVSEDGTATYVKTLTEDDAQSPLRATAGDRLGAVLAGYDEYNYDGDPAIDFGGVVAGVPDKTVDGQAQAGAIIAFSHGTDSFFFGYEESQDYPHVPGAAEPGDHFGAAVSAYRSGVAVGVPGEDIGSIKDAGLVQTFGNDSDDPFGPLFPPAGTFTQNSPGVPGTAEASDHFGASVSIGQQSGIPFCTYSVRVPTVLAIGVPGEDNSGHVDSGTVVVQTVRPEALPNGECTTVFAYRGLTQGPGGALGGANESGDQVGASVDVTAGGRTPGIVTVGAPGEDIGGTVDAGTAATYDNSTQAVQVLGNLGGRQAGLRFGAVLANSGNE